MATVTDDRVAAEANPSLAAEALKQKLWTHRLVSLLDMLRPYASIYIHVSRYCRQFANELLKGEPEAFDRRIAPGMQHELGVFIQHLRMADLDMSMTAAVRLQSALSGPMQTERVQAGLIALEQYLSDELSTRRFLYVPNRAAEYYETPFGGWETAIDNFGIRFDVGEAGKCFALGRHTACVMHLMRVLEVGLKAFARHCGAEWVEDVHSWDTIIRRINERIRTIPGERKADQQRLSEIASHLRLAKDAWRDYAMHRPAEYGEESAQNIFASVKAFMRDLAVELAERPFPDVASDHA